MGSYTTHFESAHFEIPLPQGFPLPAKAGIQSIFFREQGEWASGKSYIWLGSALQLVRVKLCNTGVSHRDTQMIGTTTQLLMGPSRDDKRYLINERFKEDPISSLQPTVFFYKFPRPRLLKDCSGHNGPNCPLLKNSRAQWIVREPSVGRRRHPIPTSFFSIVGVQRRFPNQ